METKRILVVAAHPDDEALGCGGALAKHAAAGAEVAALFLTNGAGARSDASDAQIAARRAAMEQAAEILGIRKLSQLDFPDNALDTVPLLEVAKAVESFASDFGLPDVVYTHHSGDLNVDHQIAHRAALTCFRPQPGRQVGEIRVFETLSSTGWFGSNRGESRFQPCLIVDIADFWECKKAALEAYTAEMRNWPHARSIGAVEALARHRGSVAGVEMAEAFGLEWRLER